MRTKTKKDRKHKRREDYTVVRKKGKRSEVNQNKQKGNKNIKERKKLKEQDLKEA